MSYQVLLIFFLFLHSDRKHLLASGNGRGEVKVWKLNDDLVSHKPRDQDILESLAVLHVD